MASPKKPPAKPAHASQERRSKGASRRRSPVKRPPASKPDLGKVGTPDVKVFIAEYIKDHNGRRAAIAAGYSPRSADSTASRLLKTAKVRAEVDKAHTEVIEHVKAETGVTLERVVREIARIAFFDVRRMADENGDPIPLHKLDDETAAVVAGLDVQELWEGKGKDREVIGVVKKWKLSAKDKALDMLMKHLNGYKADNEGKVQPFGEALAGFLGQIHSAGGSRLPIRAPAPPVKAHP